MNMKGASGVGIALVIAAFLMVGVLGGGVWYFGKSQASIIEETISPEAKEETAKVSNFCSNNPDIDWEVKARNDLSATSSYVRGKIYTVDKTDSQVIGEQSITATTSTRTDLTNSFKCGHQYEVYAISMQDGNYTGFEAPLTFSATDTQQDPIIKDINVQVSNSTYLMRCYDNRLSAWLYDNSSTSNTADKKVGSVKDTNFTSTTGAGTYMDLGNNEDFDVTCEIRTGSDTRFGMNVLLGLDYSDDTDTGDWKDNDFKVQWEGTTIEEFSPVNNDRIALTGNEKFWKLNGGFNEDYQKLHLVGKTDSTATVDRDLLFRTCGTGTYLSDTDNTQLLHDVCFRNDGSTRTEIATATGKGFRFMID